MQTDSLITQAEDSLLGIYARWQIILDYGKGVWLYDKEGKEYLDFGAGIAVCGLGYGHEKLNNILKQQIDKIIHTSNLYYNEPAILAAEKLRQASKMDKIFFTNSGTEANEGIIKVAKKYAFLRDKHNKHNIIAFHNSFHGRSLGALSITGNATYRDPFKPLLEGIRFVDFNDITSVEQNIDSETCAIILETIQGEGGITPANKDFLRKLRHICDEQDILLIFDEIQCGMGRTGKMFAWEHYGIMPDVFSSAKALGCGVPVGAFGVNEKVSNASLMKGDHGTTYGGNPLVCAGVSAVFDIFKEEKIVENANEMGEYLANRLDSLVEKYKVLMKRQGIGLLQGIWIEEPNVNNQDSDIESGGIQNTKIIQKALENGLIILAAGGNSLRFTPPLIVTKQDIDTMIARLEKTLVDLKLS
ncbi:aspartate aminotransferase family protein [Helicobacter didelphidarum]|uniref:Acetylornithine aminotransferase n=1 Tax=Helicobacter didelphidarum TaxID=2040648 RepID=A0A3D8IGA4_9HELI|nr:aspartate aminotransferase family protein [Helicobacter didelphidarum]RDU64219.1 aspartate aminotransferase family protein [Helicobacter didelphidarum]